MSASCPRHAGVKRKEKMITTKNTQDKKKKEIRNKVLGIRKKPVKLKHH